jgi:translation initiation factor IF-1
MSSDFIEAFGVILEEHRGGIYRVEATIAGAKRPVIARLSGRLVKHRIRVLPGDVVTLELSPYDVTKGRIVYRGRRERGYAA